MEIIEVDLVYAKPLQAFLDGLASVLRFAIDNTAVTKSETEFGGEENLVALAGAFEPGG